MPEPSQSSSTNSDVTNPSPVSAAKLEANRRNAQHSTGPRTDTGKEHSRQNALKHGILAPVALHTKGAGAEDSELFQHLLDDLRRDLKPVGTQEDLVVQNIGICYWRERRALQFEAGTMQERFSGESVHLRRIVSGKEPGQLRLPNARDMDRLLRYGTANNKQLEQLYSRLERLQVARKRDEQERSTEDEADQAALAVGEKKDLVLSDR